MRNIWLKTWPPVAWKLYNVQNVENVGITYALLWLFNIRHYHVFLNEADMVKDIFGINGYEADMVEDIFGIIGFTDLKTKIRIVNI